MSMYGDDRKGRDKENLYDELKDFIEQYGLAELLRIVADAVEDA